MTSSKPPIAVIIYRRPDLTRKVLRRVFESEPSRLYVIADGKKYGDPKSHLVDEARAVLEEFDWACPVERLFSDHNLGLRNRVISGLDAVFQRETAAIILEDDCLPSPSFFGFAEAGLRAFSEVAEVSLISGSNPVSLAEDLPYYFSDESPIWGWATWSRTWQDFRENSAGRSFSRAQIRLITKTIPGLFARRRYANFLRASDRLDSWAIEFSAFNRLNARVAVVSGVNLVENAGFGIDSTHTKFESFVDHAQAKDLDSIPTFDSSKIIVNKNNERRRSLKRGLEWVRYPLLHPLDFGVRFVKFFRVALQSKTT